MQTLEKRDARSAQKMLMFESGLAVAEMSQARLDTLHDKVLKKYVARLGTFNPRNNDAFDEYLGKPYTFSLHNALAEDFKHNICPDQISGKKIWAAYTYLKSEIINHWLPHFEIKSGEDVDDTVECVRMHVWAFRANRTIKANNNNKN